MHGQKNINVSHVCKFTSLRAIHHCQHDDTKIIRTLHIVTFRFCFVFPVGCHFKKTSTIWYIVHFLFRPIRLYILETIKVDPSNSIMLTNNCINNTECPTRYRTRLAGWRTTAPCRNNQAHYRHILQTHSFSFLTQRTYSCSNFVAISSLVLELLKKCRVRQRVGHPVLHIFKVYEINCCVTD